MVDSRVKRSGRLAVVEDNRFERSYLTDMLQEHGHEVRAFARAEELLDDLGWDHFDVIVTDLMMEGIGGQGLIESLRDRGTHAEIIVVTMMSDADSAVRAMRAGAFDYLVKPVNDDVMALTVARCIEKRRLLEHNRRLRRDLELALAGQRLLTASSPERIAETTLAALQQYLGIDAGLVEAAESAMHVFNFNAGQAEIALQVAREAADENFSRIEIAALQNQYCCSYGACLGEGEESLKIVMACETESSVPDDDDLADATFLLHHAHNALVNERIYARARDEALRDSLTGLFNARYFEDTLSRVLESGQYNDSNLAVLFLDIDHFKQVNDSLGHLIGSKLLVEMGKVLRRCVRENDLVARFGGDEFVILLENANPHWAQVVADRIRASVSRRPFLSREGPAVHVTVCVGIACFPKHGRSARELCELADKAMYMGKHGTRNAVCMSSSPTSS